ncbi:MAG TPA: thioredoxin domain-containing protein, partial [Draconibacterium sp.]|nr:thioredoxin domain-containing protein [Draconibacterium sp.]
KMKKLLFILAVAVISLQSCNAGQAKNNGNENKTTDSPAETVSQSNVNEGGTVKLTKAKFLAEVWDYENSPQEWKYKGTKPAMIDFYADWCGPCRTAAPILEEISKEYAGKITIYKIDTEVERELAGVFGISGIPAFLYIPKDGKPSMTSGIGRSKEDTKKMFQENIEKLLLTANK